MGLGVLLGRVILVADWLPAKAVPVPVLGAIEQVSDIPHKVHLDAHLGDAGPSGFKDVIVVAPAPQNEPLFAPDHTLNVLRHYVQIIGMEWKLRGHSGSTRGSLGGRKLWDFSFLSDDLGGDLYNAVLRGCCPRIEPPDAYEEGFCRITGLGDLSYLVIDGGHLRAHCSHLNLSHQLSGFGAVLGGLDGVASVPSHLCLQSVLEDGHDRKDRSEDDDYPVWPSAPLNLGLSVGIGSLVLGYILTRGYLGVGCHRLLLPCTSLFVGGLLCFWCLVPLFG